MSKTLYITQINHRESNAQQVVLYNIIVFARLSVQSFVADPGHSLFSETRVARKLQIRPKKYGEKVVSRLVNRQIMCSVTNL